MGKKQGLIEKNEEETTHIAKVSVKETPVVETPKQKIMTTGYPSRVFRNRSING